MRTACVIALCLAAAACGPFGQVNQGRTVAFDKAAGTVTIVDESGAIRTLRVPGDPKEMGPAPAAGPLVRIDRERGVAIIYEAGALREVPAASAGAYQSGDEIRYYYKDPGQALRLMNVTKTDLTKGK